MDDYEPPHNMTSGDALACVVVGAILGLATAAGAYFLFGVRLVFAS